MGMAGIPWFTTDMGGFHDGIIDSDDFKELLARWCAFSCFLPVMRNHATVVCIRQPARRPSPIRPETTVRQVVPTMSLGVMAPRRSRSSESSLPFARKCAYTRELFESAHTDGQPLVRGLFYEFPQDESVSDIADEYMFGPDILVAPVVEAGARSREVTLPGNASITWTDLRTGKVYEGGKNHCRRRNRHDSTFARDGHDHGLIGML